VSAAALSSERDRADISTAIGELFGARAGLAAAYADLLCTDGIERGLLGPREAERIWERHLLNSAILASVIPPGVRVIDLGSGAGLPGIPLAIARPDLEVVLLEPMLRRVVFLQDCLAALGLPGVAIHHGRAEAGVSPRADVVVTRAVASLEKLMRLSAGLLVDNGSLLALKGQGAAGELEQVRQTIAVDAELLTLAAPGRAATVIHVVAPWATAPTTPRRLTHKGSR
jgi:16S rRNA (guanine527-N7)-methyltransferase